MGMLQQPFVAFVVAYAHQDLGASTTVTTVIAATWIVGVVLASARASRGRHEPRTIPLGASAAVVLAGVLGATVVPFAVAIAAGIAACAYGISMLTLTVKSRVVELHPGLVGSAFALVSTVEFAGFLVPLGFGRVADAYGVHAGLLCFTAVALVLLVAAAAGDRHDPRRRSGGPDGPPTLDGHRGPEVGAA
jgi:hypothetical protein